MEKDTSSQPTENSDHQQSHQQSEGMRDGESHLTETTADTPTTPHAVRRRSTLGRRQSLARSVRSARRSGLDEEEYFHYPDHLERRESRRRSQGQWDREGALTEIAADPPASPVEFRRQSSLERRQSIARSLRGSEADDDIELTEVALDAPDRLRSYDEEAIIEGSSQTSETEADGVPRDQPLEDDKLDDGIQLEPERSVFATELYIHAYLVLFSIFGVLARLGIEAINFYPGAPAISPVLWANFSGSFIFGFLLEDQRLFREEWGDPEANSHNGITRTTTRNSLIEAAKKKHSTIKKTIPLYIGLTTGFCGSFTSFSSFMRDAFSALSNTLASPHLSPSSPETIHRHAGYSFEALIAIILMQVSLSLAAFHFGAHFALIIDPFLPTLPFMFCRRFLDPLAVFLAIGCWVGAIFLAAFTPHNTSLLTDRFVLFSIVFAPLGCLLRFQLSKHLNALVPSFPLGTFISNIFGTLVLGMCFDIQHSPHLLSHLYSSPHSATISCEVLQGVQEGFCGALTTVSTWVAELNGLRRSHGYIYGVSSIAIGIASLVVVMGSLLWTQGFGTVACNVLR